MKDRDISHYLSGANRARRKRKFFYWTIFVLGAVYLLFIVFGVLVIRTGIFRAKEIKITGNRDVSEYDIRQALEAQVFEGRSFNYLLGFNNFLIWPDHIQDPDKFLPQIKSMDVEKNYWTRSITVRVSERTPSGMWCSSASGTNCFWFDDAGKIFKKGPLTQGNLIKTVNDDSGRKLGLSGYVLPANYFQNLRSIFEVLDEAGVGVEAAYLKDLALEEVSIKLTTGPELYFGLRSASDWALPALRSLASQGSFGKLKYADFRIENRVYYK